MSTDHRLEALRERQRDLLLDMTKRMRARCVAAEEAAAQALTEIAELRAVVLRHDQRIDGHDAAFEHEAARRDVYGDELARLTTLTERLASDARGARIAVDEIERAATGGRDDGKRI